MKIKITSDSTCDLSPELLRENDIELFPLFINKGDESFRDGVDIQPADIAECLRYRFPQPLHRSGPCCARGLPPCKDRHGP